MLYFKFYDKSSKGNSLLRKKLRTPWVKFLSKIHKMFRLCAEFDDKIFHVAQCFIEYDEAYKSLW